MSLWKLEWIRLTRTRRWIALVGVYLFLGFTGPLLARYMADILERAGGGIEVAVPEPVPADGMAQYVSNATQIGLLVSVGLAASALTVDSNRQMNIFLRTRVERMWDIVTPRYVVITGAIMFSFTAGSLAALYETWALLGSLPFGDWAAGTALGCLYLAFVVAVVAAVAGRSSSVIIVAVTTFGILLVLPIIGLIPSLEEWMPSHLVGALDSLVLEASPGDYVKAAVTTLASTLLLLGLGVRWADRRNLQ